MDSSTRGPSSRRGSGRNRVRLLFAGFLLCYVILFLIRTRFGDTYPGPFMPSFRGNGLKMSSPTEGSVMVANLSVGFSDQTSTEITEPRFFGNTPAALYQPIVLMMSARLFHGEVGFRGKVRNWLAHAYFGEPPSPPFSSEIPDDIRHYCRERLARVYPGKTPVSLTISFYDESFSLDDFHKVKLNLLSKRTIDLHEGA